MSRRVKLLSKELGEIRLLIVWEGLDGSWDTDWAPLKGTRIEPLFSRTSEETYQHALVGLVGPLAKTLGLPPVGCLAKIPKDMRECTKKSTCPLYDKKSCFPTAKGVFSWCFEGMPDPEASKALASAIETWREGVYILIVVKERETTAND